MPFGLAVHPFWGVFFVFVELTDTFLTKGHGVATSVSFRFFQVAHKIWIGKLGFQRLVYMNVAAQILVFEEGGSGLLDMLVPKVIGNTSGSAGFGSPGGRCHRLRR